MIDATLIAVEPSAALISVDLWDPASLERMAPLLPDFGMSRDWEDGWRVIGAEPSRWWLIVPLDQRFDQLAVLTEQLGDAGAVVDTSGAILSVRVAGRRWRTLLTVGGVFDAEDPGFAVGSSISTLLHHVTVRYDVLADDTVIVHVGPSYAQHLVHHLRLAAAMIDVMKTYTNRP